MQRFPFKSQTPSAFERVVRALEKREGDATGVGLKWLSASFLTRPIPEAILEPLQCSPGPGDRYFEMCSERIAPVELPRSLEDIVRDELKLSEKYVSAELEKIRRTFAFENHPDRPDVGDKALALRRMTIANILVDQAIKAAQTRPSR